MKLRLLSATGLILCSSISFALPAPPLKNIEVYGKVTLNGQAAVDIPVEFRTGNCFAELDAKTKTNKNGFYYIKLSSFFHAGGGLYVSVPAPKTAQALYAPHCTYEPVEFTYRSNQKVRYNIVLKKPQAISQDEKQCIAKGGQWGPLTQTRIGCNFSYKDYTQICTDGSQCLAKICLPNRRIANAGFCPMDTYQILNATASIQKGKKVEKKAD